MIFCCWKRKRKKKLEKAKFLKFIVEGIMKCSNTFLKMRVIDLFCRKQKKKEKAMIHFNIPDFFSNGKSFSFNLFKCSHITLKQSPKCSVSQRQIFLLCKHLRTLSWNSYKKYLDVMIISNPFVKDVIPYIMKSLVRK